MDNINRIIENNTASKRPATPEEGQLRALLARYGAKDNRNTRPLAKEFEDARTPRGPLGPDNGTPPSMTAAASLGSAPPQEEQHLVPHTLTQRFL